MKILFDTQIFDWQINGGISRYFIELIDRLDADKDIEVIFKCKHSYNTYIQNTKWLRAAPRLTGINFKGKLLMVKKVNELMNRGFSNGILRGGKQNIFHPTYYDPYFFKYIGEKPFVLTVYDLTNERFRDSSALTRKILDWKKHLIAKAEHIVAISENTKKDIVEYYRVHPDKVSTVYLASSFDISASNAENAQWEQVDKPYVLFVGSRNGYKNFKAFVTEAAPLLKRYKLQLVLAGGGSLNADEINQLKTLNINERVTAFPHVSDRYLAKLYTNAMVFVFPSLYEGFGIPVLEAMQCRCPTLLSNNSSLPEVGGNAAQYFDPLKKDDMSNSLERLILDKELRSNMKDAGLLQAAKFNWDITAAGHLDVYKLFTT